jgi:CDP-6-deoxy-D-xylo-4-hexulose-3-dehydrase
MEYNWPLSIPQFSWVDKLRFVKFILTDDRWTQGTVVANFEKEMAEYVGSKYAVFTSSGSTANTLLAMYLKDNMPHEKNTVVFPSTTWITSVSPFIREGFKAKFIDISLHDFSMDLDKLEEYLKKESDKIACVFITSLIGFTPNIPKIKALEITYRVRIMMDNCENTLGKCGNRNISSYFTSTTSTYFGHQIQSVEGGFIFTNSQHEYEYFLMARNHGMLRHLPTDRIPYYRNPNVDGRFDFHMLGNNFRNTNINAFLGLCDLKRADSYYETRRELYSLYREYMSEFFLFPAEEPNIYHAPFCLPVILKKRYAKHLSSLQSVCAVTGIETRPIISGNLLRQTCFKNEHYKSFINSEYLHQNGFYVGLHGAIKKSSVEDLCEIFSVILL